MNIGKSLGAQIEKLAAAGGSKAEEEVVQEAGRAIASMSPDVSHLVSPVKAAGKGFKGVVRAGCSSVPEPRSNAGLVVDSSDKLESPKRLKDADLVPGKIWTVDDELQANNAWWANYHDADSVIQDMVDEFNAEEQYGQRDVLINAWIDLKNQHRNSVQSALDAIGDLKPNASDAEVSAFHESRSQAWENDLISLNNDENALIQQYADALGDQPVGGGGASGPEGAAFHTGLNTVKAANEVLMDYRSRGITYSQHHEIPSTADCTTMVHDIEVKAGYSVPYLTTSQFEDNPLFENVTDHPLPGDVMIQLGKPDEDGNIRGHAGIFGGYIDKQGRPWGIQMGSHGPCPAPFGPKGWFKQYDGSFEFYRPKNPPINAN